MAGKTPEARLRNLKLVLAYEGTRFKGWQKQERARSVAGVVEKALAEVFGTAPAFHAAGRTDAGAHAEGQVINFRTRDARSSDSIRRALCAVLPVDVTVRAAEWVPLDFHARHSPVSRTYRYQVAREFNPFLRRHAWTPERPPDVGILKSLAAALIGRPDFRSFSDGKARGQMPEEGFRCRVFESVWLEQGELLIYRITADHFLWKMVRRLVGTMVSVAAGALSEEEWRRWLREPSREPARYTAPPYGLFLERVNYPERSRLSSPASVSD